MSGVESAERVEQAEQWSWVVATLATIGLFSASIWLTADVQFSAVVAAGVGIAVQYLVPYLARRSTPSGSRAVENDSTGSDVNHGAAGGALLVGSLAALAVTALRMDSTTGLITGSLLAVVSYVPLSSILPGR